MSRELAILTENGRIKPNVTDALGPHNLPFVEYCRQAHEDMWGVIKVKNIPYSVSRQEILAFLGRNARLVPEQDGEAVHIIMERVTSKTLDAYIEFASFDEAVAAVARFETNRTGGRGGRLGQRHVEVEVSSQDALMKDLFPKAKNVSWRNGRPEIVPTNPNDLYNSGFTGFISREEIVMLIKHVEAPQRSPFSKDCPQRPFECLISTLQKYPWYMVDFITIEDRNLLFKATVELLTLLIDRINNEVDTINLNTMLYKRVWKAALKCKGFTPTMKDDIVVSCEIDEMIAKETCGIAPYAAHWKSLWTIGAKSNAPSDLVLCYISLLREASESQKRNLSLAEQAAVGHDKHEFKLFGDLDKYIGHDGTKLAQMTLAEVARAEWYAVELLLRQALTPAIEGGK
ncbi:hypothetical protein BJ878DRAFT_419329 [Calycina marina]|uniref:RRM domain-containing protein n=1 Tax=Calycina marina TaxID=1763456 RepID=A0A9P8CG57_9HELO|nr:hypothetical protein BJ878DRAFT_419329 [Calycina marina]